MRLRREKPSDRRKTIKLQVGLGENFYTIWERCGHFTATFYDNTPGSYLVTGTFPTVREAVGALRLKLLRYRDPKIDALMRELDGDSHGTIHQKADLFVDYKWNRDNSLFSGKTHPNKNRI